MPDFGTPVAQNIQSPDFTKTLGGLMGLQQQKQQIESGALGIQKQQQDLQTGANTADQAQQTMQERQRLTQMMKIGADDRGNTILGKNGEPDPALLVPAAIRMAPLIGPDFAKHIMDTQSARVALGTASLSLGSAQRQAVQGPLQAYALNPTPEMFQKASDAMDLWKTTNPEMGTVVDGGKQLLAHIGKAETPQDRSKAANSMAALFQGGQQVQTQPQSSSVENGQTIQPGTTAPPVAGGGFTPQGTPIGKQPPPTTNVVDEAGKPHLYGAQPPLAQGQAGPATGLAPGASGNLENNYNEMNRHFASLQDQSSGAALIGALTGNIKALAPAAVTGTEAGRKTYVNGLLNAFGLGDKASGDLQKDTDLLEKNMAQLNMSSPASTDAMRTLITAGRPHGTMSASAITEAADQVASQVQANMALRNKLSPSKYANNGQGDPLGYQSQREPLEKIADPRAFQYMRLGPGSPAAKQFVQKLTPQDREELGNNVGALERAGMLK